MYYEDLLRLPCSCFGRPYRLRELVKVKRAAVEESRSEGSQVQMRSQITYAVLLLLSRQILGGRVLLKHALHP
jgi:hypothetical protein